MGLLMLGHLFVWCSSHVFRLLCRELGCIINT
nr:MAG TPA: hypothetical protein [Caudoviricetes sp.]